MPASLDDWLITPSISQTFSLALPGYTDMSMWQACNRLLNLLPSASALNLHSESESEVTQPCLTLCDPTDCSLPGFSIHGIFQARILEWVAISFSRGSSRPRSPALAGRFFTVCVTREAHIYCGWCSKNLATFQVEEILSDYLQKCIVDGWKLTTWNAPGETHM